MRLAEKHCVPCKGDEPALGEEEIVRHLSELNPDWKVVGEGKIQRDISVNNFAEGLALANKIGEIAEAEDHHPDLHLSYKNITVELSTHAIGGLSENDFIVAAKIDALLV